MKPSLNRTRKHLIKNKNGYVFSFLFLFALFILLPLNSAIAASRYHGQGHQQAIEDLQNFYQQYYQTSNKNSNQQPANEGNYSEDSEEEGGGGSNGEGTPVQQESVLYDDGKPSPSNDKQTAIEKAEANYPDLSKKYGNLNTVPQVIDPKLNEKIRGLMEEYELDKTMLVDGCYIDGRETQCPVAIKYATVLKEEAIKTQRELNRLIQQYEEDGEQIPLQLAEHLADVQASIDEANSIHDSVAKDALIGNWNAIKNGNGEYMPLGSIDSALNRKSNMEHANPLAKNLGQLLGDTEWLSSGYLPIHKALKAVLGEDSVIAAYCEQSMIENPDPNSSEYAKKVGKAFLAPVAVAGATALAALGISAAAPAIGTIGVAGQAVGIAAGTLGPIAAYLGWSSVSDSKEKAQQLQNQQLASKINNTSSYDLGKEDYGRIFQTNESGDLARISTTMTNQQAIDASRFSQKDNAWSNLGDSISNAFEEKFGGHTPTPKILQNVPEVDVSSFSNSASSSSSSYAAEPVQQSSPASSNVVDGLKSMSSDEWEAAFEKAGMD